MDSILIGKIVNVHGIKGEVKIYPYTDDTYNLSKLKEIYFDSSLKESYAIKSCKIIKNMLVLKLQGIDTVEAADVLKNKELFIPKLVIDETDTYYIADLIDCDVIDMEKNDIIGKITYVFNTGANDVYEVETPDKNKVYLPAIKQVVKNVDVKDKKIYVKLMDGLI
ncbi:MAG: ribosome maturation factor RimM [Clostridia bacterium]|nr:ribosome maturation factor RimM [Clostridia bacterium]